MGLHELNLSRTPVAGLSALTGVPLETLNLADSRVGADDAARVAALPLKSLIAGDDFLKDAAQTLKQCHTLATVNGQSMAEFRFKYPDLLVQENFERFDLQHLPPGWAALERPSLSLVEKPGRGHVLCISNKTDTGGSPSLEVTLDASKLKSRTIVLSALAYCPGGFGVAGPADKPLIYAYYKLATNKPSESPPAYLESYLGMIDWVPLKVTCVVPVNALTATISIKVQHIPAEVFFDDLKVELLPAQAPPIKK